MSRVTKLVLLANLLALALLVFVYPHLMVGPGKLIPGHASLEADCFACHAPLQGADSQRCITCHQPATIGKLSSTGMPLIKPLTTVPFHQGLRTNDCVACHSDHAGVKRFRQAGRFDHTLLKRDIGEQCQTCHQAPKDALHRQVTGTCTQCHAQDKWVPATFDHDKYFVLDRDHTTTCATCHERNDYSRYTCYGCHEHTPQNIRREHVEEGIRDFANCVECHRSADEHDIRGRSERGGRETRGKDDDD